MPKFKKGISGNKEGRPKTNPDGTLSLSVVNLSIPDSPTEINKGNVYSAIRDEWIPFGSDNLFPQAVSAINRQSAIHRGILNNKVIYTTGWGFTFDETNKKLDAFVKKANNKDETLRGVVKKIITDKLHSGNAFLELVTDTKKSFLNIFHRDYTTARVGKGGDTIKLHSNWANILTNRS